MKSRLLRPLCLSLAATVLAGAALRAQPAPSVPDQLDLKAAIGFAVGNNFAIRQARERIKQQEGVVTQVTAQQLPTVAANGYAQANSTEISQTYPQSDRYWTVTIIATQTLYAGGGVRSSIRSSDLTREAALLDLKSVINDALLTVRTAFYSVLLDREKITVQEKNVELLQQQLKDVSNRFDAGTVSSFEKLRAEVALANAKTPLITARNDYRLAIESLRQALGLTGAGAQSKPLDVVGNLDYTPMAFDLAAAFESAKANLPDLQRLEKLAKANEESVTTARSGYLPTVAAYGGWGLAKGLTNSFDDSFQGWEIGVKSQWNIFDGRATAGKVSQARSVLQQSRLSLDEAELTAEVAVRRAYSSWQEATELADASKKVTGQAEEAVRLANARYSAGTSTQLDVLQAQVDLTTARTNELQAYYTYVVAVATLRNAMGLSDELVAE
jgi:outer membrane protein TolC